MARPGALVRLSKACSRKGILRQLESELASLPRGASILSVGAGGDIGAAVHRYTRVNAGDLTELDVDPKRNPNIVADLCDWVPDRPYDCVILSEVLEHVRYPDRAMATALAALRPAGKLILTVPFIFPIHDRPYDYFRYTRFGVEHLLSRFASVRIEERNSWPEAVLVLLLRSWSSSNRWVNFASPAIVATALGLYPAAWLLGRLAPSDFLTTGYFAVALKPAAGDIGS
jgi:SAM-dependent methyltransferase